MSEKIDLIKDGQIQFAIHRQPWQRAEEMLEVVDAFSRVLQISFGKQPPYAVFHLPSEQPIALTLELDVQSDLALDGFEVTVNDQSISLIGRNVAGLSNAANWFLEKFIGARWLWPGESGEVIPKHENLSIPVGSWREEPDYTWRQIGTGGPIHQAMDYNTTMHALHGLSREYLDDFQVWLKRNRFGGPRVIDGHRFVQIAPPEKHAQSHPHIYALVDGERDTAVGDGKHGNQPCLTHPDTTKVMAKYVCNIFDADPSIDVFSIALNDGGKQCECERCLAFDEEVNKAGKVKGGAFDTDMDEVGDEDDEQPISVTDRVVWQANQVIKKVAKKHPNKKLLILLYNRYRTPPIKYKLDERVLGQFCIRASEFWRHDNRQSEIEQLSDMGEVVPTLGIYEYFSQGVWPEAHRVYPKLIEQAARDYHVAGARYFATQPTTGFATNGINLFVLGRCLWDISETSEAAIRDWCDSGFGNSANTISSFIYAFADRWRQTRSGSTAGDAPLRYQRISQLAHLYPGDFILDRQAELDQAMAEAAADLDTLRRIEFLQKGLSYTAKLAHACVLTVRAILQLKLDEQGNPIEPADDQISEHLAQDARSAAAAWDDFWAYVRENKQQYVFGEFWIHYRVFPGNEQGEYLQLLKRIAGTQ